MINEQSSVNYPKHSYVEDNLLFYFTFLVSTPSDLTDINNIFRVVTIYILKDENPQISQLLQAKPLVVLT